MGDVDIALRQVTTRHPEDLAWCFARAGQTPRSARWIDTQLAARELRADRGLLMELPAIRLVGHLEWFIDLVPEMPWRMCEYVVQLLAALRQGDAAQEAAAREHALRVGGATAYVAPKPLHAESCAVLLDGPERPLPP